MTAMRHPKHRRLLTALFSSALLALAAGAQEPDVEILPPGSEPPRRAQADDPEQRLRELFSKVERRLDAIDLLLSDAAAGDTSRLDEAEAAGIDRLLRDSVDSGRQVQSDIEEILRIAQEMGQQQSSSSGGSSSDSQQQQGGEPQGSQTSRGQQQQSGEQTPSMPESQPGGEQPGGDEPQDQPGGDQPEGQQPGELGQQPEGPQGSEADGQNVDNADSAAKEGSGGGLDPQGAESWGNLPQHVRDTFRAEGRGDLPVRYRDWIDSYYKKLNRRSTSDR